MKKYSIHMIKKYISTFFLLAFVISACTSAKNIGEISAIRTPVGPYLKMSCEELITEQRVILAEFEAAGASVEKSYRSEKNTELVTWLLFFPAAFMLDGNQEQASAYAAKKGQLDAVNEALQINKCGVTKTESNPG